MDRRRFDSVQALRAIAALAIYEMLKSGLSLMED